MQELFLELVKLSLPGSLIALAVMLVRLVFRKAPKWIFCALWGVVALRLIFPVSVESELSLVPDRLASGQIIANVGSEYIGEVDVIYENNAGYSNALKAGREPVYSEDGYYVVTEQGSLNAPATIGDTVFPVLSWVWAAGTVAMLAYLAVSFLLIKRKMAEATRLVENIWQCERVDSPFVLGIVKPRIYLPYAITEADAGNVIAHEQAHIRRKDHWWKPIGFLLLAVHWFNPVMWLAYSFLCRDIEGACDEKVIKHMGKEEMRAYSTALLHCSIRGSVLACPLAFGEVGAKGRIKRIMNYKKPAFWVIGAAVVICVIVAVCFLTNPAASPKFSMTGSNVSDLDVDAIISRIQEIEGLEDGNPYLNANNFSLRIDSDFNWADSQAVRYFFDEGKKTHSAQLRIFPNENAYFITESAKWAVQKDRFLLRHYLDAIKYLPQEAIRQMAPADMYIVRQMEEGSPDDYSRVITYTPNGAQEIDSWLIHLQLEPLHSAKEGYEGVGDEVVQLFYAGEKGQADNTSRLLKLVSEIANNREVAFSSNPFDYIAAKKALYDEIISYGSSAVDCFVEQLRSGENGLQGYIMAVACADITGIGDKDLGADWATAQQWLALYDNSAANGRTVPMTLDDVFALAAKGTKLTWEDLKGFTGRDVGSGLYIARYDIDDAFYLLVGDGKLTGTPMYARLCVSADAYVDIMTGDVKAFVDTYRPNALDGAISEAIAEHYRSDWPDGLLHTYGYVLIGYETASETPVQGQNNRFTEIAVYLLVKGKTYSVRDNTVSPVEGGLEVPTRMRFRVDSEENYELLEYWTPSTEGYVNGEYDPNDVRERFTEEIAEEALNIDKYELQLNQICDSKALAYLRKMGNIDSVSFDIDGDGKQEMCALSNGPTSGLFSFTFTASPVELTASSPKYSEVFVLSDHYKLSFEITEGILRIRGDRNHPSEQTVFFDIAVNDGHILLQCEEEGIFLE